MRNTPLLPKAVLAPLLRKGSMNANSSLAKAAEGAHNSSSPAKGRWPKAGGVLTVVFVKFKNCMQRVC